MAAALKPAKTLQEPTAVPDVRIRHRVGPAGHARFATALDHLDGRRAKARDDPIQQMSDPAGDQQEPTLLNEPAT
jgi:hypothetical protein